MSINKNLKIKDVVIKVLSENDKSFFYLAPEVVGSINNANLDYDKNILVIDFNTTNGKNMALKTPYNCFQKWEETNNNEPGDVLKFLIDFISNSKEVENNYDLNEIVDEFGDIMADEDEPSNKNFGGVGRSKFDSNKTAKQTLAKQKRFYSDYGLGTITW